jgi:PAS domain S-box-containing protein
MLNQHSTRAAHFSELLDAAPDAMIIVDRTGRILLANPLAENLFGYEASELVGQSSAVLMPLRFRERHDAHRARFFTTPSKRPMGAGMELLGVRKLGDEFPVEISLSPLTTSDGVLAISAIRDITERKRATEKLEQTNRDLQNALDLVKQLTGILPICGFCKKIRDSAGDWKPLENYIREHSEARFSHGFCPDCGRMHYGDWADGS